MGYYIFSYAIDTARVEKAIGSGDDHLYKEILNTDTFQLYSSQDLEGHTTTKNALEHLLFGKPYNSASAHAYWYALIALCSNLGKRLPATHEIKLGYETDFINDFLESDFGIKITIEEILLNGNQTFELPRVRDWPLSGLLLNKTDLISLQQTFNGVAITDDVLEKLLNEDEEREMAYDSIRQIKENISYCLTNNLDLISFCH